MKEDTCNMHFIGRGPIYDESGEVSNFVIDPEDARDFVEHHLRYGSQSVELVPVSVKLPAVTNSVLENNASVLGMSKSDLHRKALEIGLNEITKEYCSLTKQQHIIQE